MAKEDTAVERFYTHGKPQCGQKSLVPRRSLRGALEFHVCELVKGHEGECERCPTGCLASCIHWDKYPKYETAYVPGL
jgi:hypothetical protein